MPEHGRALLGLVAADSLENARSVVEAVAEDVDVGVVPSDELAIHPDPVGLLHVFLSGSVAAARKVCRTPSSPRLGYAAATIGAGDIKENAVRSEHVKDGTLAQGDDIAHTADRVRVDFVVKSN